MYSPSRAHSPVHRLHSRNAPKSYRRFFSLGLGSSRSFRLHPIFLIPIFLLGTLFSPFTSTTTGTSEGTGSGRREVEPVYKREDYLYTPEQSFLKPDAPPLDLLQDDLLLGSSGSGGGGRTRGDNGGGKVLARTGHGEGEDESEWWDPTTSSSSTSSTNDNQDSDSQGIYYERQGYLYFQSSPRTIPSLQQNPKFPLVPKSRPPPPVAKRPAQAQAQPVYDQSIPPPPPPSDWLTPGDLFKSPLERFSPPQLRDPLNAPLPPAPPNRPPNAARRVPLAQRIPQSEKDALVRRIGKNAQKAQLALKNGKGFVPSKPEELVLAEKEYKKELEKKKKEEIDKGFRGLVWAQVEPEKKVLGIDDDEDEEEEKEKEEEEEDEEELSDLEILKAVRELSVEEKKLLSKEEREVIRQLELKYPVPDNEKPPTRVQDLMKQPQQQQPQVGGGGGQRRGNFRDRAGAAAKEKGKFNPLVGGGQPGRERVVAGRAQQQQQQQQQQAQGRRRGGGGGGGLRKRSLPIVEDNSNEHDNDDENESSRFVLESIDESQPQPQEEEQESTDQHSKRSLTDSSSSSSPPPSLPHPITLLISQAEERWESMLRRQSQTLEQAVEEYKRRYGYPPPVGFDSWWRYAMENRIILVDEYDQIFKDIEPFRSLSPKEFKKRSKSLQTDESLPWFKHSFGIGIKSGQIKQYTHQAGKGDKNNNRERVEDLMDLLAEFSEMIPEDVELRFMNGDEPGVVVSGEAKQRHLEYASQGKFLSPQEAQELLEPSGLTPWDSLCLPNSTSRRKSQALQTDEPPSTSNTLRSFINLDHDKAIDLCLHPELKSLNGFTSWSGPRPYLLYPVFSSTKTSLHSDLLIPSISNDFYTPVGKDPIWEGKKHDKVYWRGENRGSWYSKGSGWRNNQRARLVTLANTQDETSTSTIHFTTTAEEQGGEEEESIVRTSSPIPLTSLTSYYLDIAFSGQPLQCSNSKLDQTCKDLSRDPQLRWDNPPHLQGKRGVTLLSPEEEENQYKYVLDVDANYISGKFKRLMSSRSLVFKSTIFPEWWSKRIMPWYHYVPIKSDYSDLLDISSYFIGQPDDQKSGNHDLLAKKLALRGQKWSQEHWREVDMAAYMFRLYLEYARLLHRDENDPTSMDYSG